MTRKKPSSPLEKLLDLQVLTLKPLGRWLTQHLSHATEHLPDKEGSIYRVFKRLLATILLIKKSKLFRERTSSMLGSLPKSKWTTFLDNLSSSENLNTLHIQLLQILLQELISREKAYQPFWTPAFKDVSETLLLPTGTDFAGLDSISSTNWSQKQVEESLSLKVLTTKLLNKSSPHASNFYDKKLRNELADKWEKGAMPTVNLKTLKIKFYPTPKQKLLLDKFIDTSRFVYNRTLEYINNGHKINFNDLRDLLVTENTKKGMDEYKEFDVVINDLKKQKKETKDVDQIKHFEEQIKAVHKQRRDKMKQYDYSKNPLIHEFETETPKDIRSNAVNRCCDAFKTGFTNLKKGNIKHFKMKYKKKSDKTQSIELTPKIISSQDGKIKIAPETFKDECVLKTHKPIKKFKIDHNVDILRKNNEYYVHLSVPTDAMECDSLETVAGIDLGIRTFATVHSQNSSSITIAEYKHRSDLLKKFNLKINLMKYQKHTLYVEDAQREALYKPGKKRIRKKQIAKQEKKKVDLVDRLHWDFINHVLSNNDVVYLGDIKSRDMVKGGKNKYLNVAFNDLKFHKLKQRLIYKAYVQGKKVFLVPEHYTTKTCSCCGTINNNVGSKEVFECEHCKMVTGRDMNASKNMKLKGYFL